MHEMLSEVSQKQWGGEAWSWWVCLLLGHIRGL